MDFKINNIQRNEIGNRIREFAKWFLGFDIVTAIFWGLTLIDINQDANLIFYSIFEICAFATALILIYLIYIMIVGFSFIIDNTNK